MSETQHADGVPALMSILLIVEENLCCTEWDLLLPHLDNFHAYMNKAKTHP